MEWIDALILGLIQGLTEFLPVSSSGHLELGKAILGVELQENVSFTVVVHGATVLSTIIVFWKYLLSLFKGLFQFQWNEETKYLVKIAVSMIPVGIVGILLKDYVEGLFNNKEYIILLVGGMLIITALLLIFTFFAKKRNDDLSFRSAFIIGVAQAIAVLPGISRAGATIATGLLLGVRKDLVAKFSFLMVLVPILGENVLEITGGELSETSSIDPFILMVGFAAAFITGLMACKWMINIIQKGKLLYFGIYCLIIGTVSIVWHFVR